MMPPRVRRGGIKYRRTDYDPKNMFTTRYPFEHCKALLGNGTGESDERPEGSGDLRYYQDSPKRRGIR